jgi:putative membrane protein
MSEKKSGNYSKPLILLSILHIGGLVCMKYGGLMDIFQLMVPYHLLIVLCVMLYYQKHWNFRGIGFLFGIYLAAFIVEAVGVNTGQIFGTYRYGKTLGFKVFDTPLIIGVNWLILIYSVTILIKKLPYGNLGNAALGALILTALDVLIEPVAMRTGMWIWPDAKVPIQNYAAWFVLSYIFILTLLFSKSKLRNEFAPYVFIIQMVFFLLANVI